MNTHFGKIKERSNKNEGVAYYYGLEITPNGFWGETVEASVDEVSVGKWEGEIGTSSGGQEDDYDPCKRARNQAYALIFASEWLDEKLKELNKVVA
jgi:hypothetical protein